MSEDNKNQVRYAGEQIRILFIIPYIEGEDVVKEVLAQEAYQNHIVYETLIANVGQRITVSEDRADVVISRGYTAATLQSSLPKIELRVTGFDIMRAVKSCIKEYGCKRIAVVGTFNMLYGTDSIGDLYEDTQVICCMLEREEELEETIQRLHREGAEAFVGGRSLYNKASSMGLTAVITGFGKETVKKSVDEAIRAVEIRRLEQMKRARIQTIMDYAFEGILTTDRQGIIIMANQYAQTVLANSGENLIGMPLKRYLRALPVAQVLSEGERFLSQMYRLENMTVLVNCVPLISQEQIAGSVSTFQDITQIQEEEEKIRKHLHKKGFVVKYRFEDIIGGSYRMRETVRTAEKISGSDSNLFIYGETGTGKELFAQSIHSAGRRKGGPFIAVNCAALPENLLESELFGYVEGAFTGAAKGGKKGLFELAHNGTIFLDEIGDLPLKLQARLLRVIQEREIMRLGDDKVIPVNVRVISASNRELYGEVEEGRFREDLLYRLNVLCLSVPPLRSREEDVLLLIQYYIDRIRQKSGCRLKGIKDEAQQPVMDYDWPGNVRELKNFCERLSVFCEEESAGADAVFVALYSGRAMGLNQRDEAQRAKDPDEKTEILAALACCKYSRKRTASYLGIDVSTLYRKMKRYQITV